MQARTRLDQSGFNGRLARPDRDLRGNRALPSSCASLPLSKTLDQNRSRRLDLQRDLMGSGVKARPFRHVLQERETPLSQACEAGCVSRPPNAVIRDEHQSCERARSREHCFSTLLHAGALYGNVPPPKVCPDLRPHYICHAELTTIFTNRFPALPAACSLLVTAKPAPKISLVGKTSLRMPFARGLQSNRHRRHGALNDARFGR